MSKFITLENLGIFKTKIEALIRENASLKPTNTGSTGQVLTKTASGCEWKTASTSKLDAYPVGSVYTTANNTISPAAILGGTWEGLGLSGEHEYKSTGLIEKSVRPNTYVEFKTLTIPANAHVFISGYVESTISESAIMCAQLKLYNGTTSSASLEREMTTRTNMDCGGGCSVSMAIPAVNYQRIIKLFTYGYRSTTTTMRGSFEYTIFTPRYYAWKRIA